MFGSARRKPSCCLKGLSGLRMVIGLPCLYSGPPRAGVWRLAWLLLGQELLPGPQATTSPEALTAQVVHTVLLSVGSPWPAPQVGMCQVTQKVPQPHLPETVHQEVSGWGNHEDTFLCGDEPFPTAVCSVLSEQVWRHQSVDKLSFPLKRLQSRDDV